MVSSFGGVPKPILLFINFVVVAVGCCVCVACFGFFMASLYALNVDRNVRIYSNSFRVAIMERGHMHDAIRIQIQMGHKR